MPLFVQFSCLLRFTWYFLLVKVSLHLNVINYYRGDLTSVSYFCFITRHLLFETLDTPMFSK